MDANYQHIILFDNMFRELYKNQIIDEVRKLYPGLETKYDFFFDLIVVKIETDDEPDEIQIRNPLQTLSITRDEVVFKDSGEELNLKLLS